MKFIIKYQNTFAVTTPIGGATQENLYTEEFCHAHRQEAFVYNAIIDPDGKPIVIREIIHTWEPTYEEWCKEGIDHTQKEDSCSYRVGCKLYSRKVKRPYMVKEYVTLSNLMDDIYQHRASIYFSKRLNEWVICFGLKEDEFAYEDDYDEE